VAAGALAALGTGLGCGRRPSRSDAVADGRERERGRAAETSTGRFPAFEASGPPEELGAAVGRQTAAMIRRTIDAQRGWFEELRAFALADRAARLDPFVAAADRHHPEVMAELRGLARGAGLPVDDLLIWNLQPELGALRQAAAAPGCSTLHLVAGSRIMLVHNEDGSAAYRDDLAILRLRPAGRPAILCLAYPGLVPGQVPAATSAGLVVSTNFISTREVRPGVPRYVLGRAALGCDTLDAAVALATGVDRAFAFTMNLGSIPERRLLCLELAPRAHDLSPSRGLFVHTNHLVLPGTRDVPQTTGEPTSSSGSRYQVLTAAAARVASPAALGEADLVGLLSSHEAVAQPYSPCRHTDQPTGGCTLATAVFDLTAGTFALYEGNPCERRRRTLELPWRAADRAGAST
jgi:isopenicillin-N N-acyltransferase-like protein